MDIERHYNDSGMNNRISLTALQEQYAFQLDVNIEKGKKIFGNNDKAFYEAEWIDRDGSPIVLIEKKGAASCDEILFNITLDHPHIVKTYGLVDPNGHKLDSNSVLLLQEYAPDGDLGSLLLPKYFVPKQNVLLEIFIQIADAMVFLSEQNVIHGDLACRNVLVFKSHPYDPKKNLVKLIDFGLTRNNSKAFDINTDIPVRYAPPEILRSNGQTGYSEKSDVFAFATFMHEACSSGEMPFKEIADDNEVRRQKLEDKRLTRPNKCDPNIWKLMNLCWNKRPSDRPNFRQIHTQLKNIQNVESSPSSSNWSSPKIDENLSLFQIEYEICQKCHLRYTDYDSHLNNCNEEELTCDKCFQEYRRGSFNNHNKNCEGLSDELDVDSSTQNIFIPPSKNRGRSTSKLQTNDLNRSKSDNSSSFTDSFHESTKRTIVRSKQSFSTVEIPTRQKPTETQRENIRKNSSQQLNTDQLPCQFCLKLFDKSNFQAHQTECKKRHDEEVERKRIEVEQENIIVEVECEFCKEKHSINESDQHQSICSWNPENVPDVPQSPSLSRSISAPTFPTKTERFRASTSSNESIAESEIIEPQWDVTEPTTEPPVRDKNKEPSGFRKFLLTICPFMKK